MANAFSKEEIVFFDEQVEKFNDQLVMSRVVNKFNIDSELAERTGDQYWRPQPYIAQSFDGLDQTGNFGDNTQLSVPSTIGFLKSVPWEMDSKEMRDGLQENRIAASAAQKLSSDINVATMGVAADQGTIAVKRSSAATGYDDIAEADALMNELGVSMEDRYQFLSSRDYNSMAGNLAARQTMTGKPTNAYERSYVGEVAGFDTHKLDYANSLVAAAGTTVTINGANQYYTPVSTVTTANGTNNVDNRYQTITIAVGGGTVKVGDTFTIAGVNAVHHITKGDTGQPKTFRIHSIVTGAGGSGTVQISPPIISNGGSTDAEAQYQNVTATPANGAAITFLNTVTASVNPFWHKDAMELTPGRLAVPSDSGAQVLRSTSEQGLELVFQKQFDINTSKTKFRLDTYFGVTMLQPEMAGIMQFSQT